jgi:hypothetical protein
MNTVLESWGIDPDFFASRLLFLGRWGGGGVLSAFSKDKLRFTVFLVMPPVYTSDVKGIH